MLCTSRQPLGIVGEHVWTVPSMQGPEPDEPLGAAADARYPALALFLERAVAASPGFAVTADNERAVVEICRRLDGLPLAIELAAARLRTLSPDQLAAGLRDRLNLLATRHAVPARHRTMESAFSWSYTLCTPAERDLWASVSVFADSFDLAAAERVCAGDHLLGALSGLVDKSVLVLDRATMRYRLLEPVRQFGCGRLRAAGRDRVLALRSVEFARNHGVAVHVRSSFSWEPGTWVRSSTETAEVTEGTDLIWLA